MNTTANERTGYYRLLALMLSGRVWAVIGSFLVCLCVSQISLFIYNVFFHPLREYPGPRLAAATKLPYWRALVQGDLVTWINAQHERYGNVVRVAPNELSYTNAEAWKDIYGHRVGGKISNPKDPSFYSVSENGSHSIITLNDTDHARVRRIFSHAFSDRALKEQEPLFVKYVDLLMEKLREMAQKGMEVNMVDFYNFTTFDVMGDLTFGEPLHLLGSSGYTPWVSAIFGGIKAGTILRVVKNYPFAAFLLEKLLPRSLKEKGKAHYRHSEERVDRRLEKGTGRPDIWSLVLRQTEDQALTIGEMHANANIFMIAGTETTATLLSGLTFYLLKNPEAMDKLVREIRGACPTQDDITLERLAQLRYLNASVEEGLRMYPPVPVGLPRVTPPEGAVICNRWVPGGTSIYVSQFAAYRSPTNFHSPCSFVPERWLGGGIEGSGKDIRTAFQPFSYGPRNRLGRNMAYHEIRLILAKTLWNYDLTLCPESDRWADQKTYTLWEKKPLVCTLALAGGVQTRYEGSQHHGM